MNRTNKNKKTAAEKVAIFRSYFCGLTDVYGTYDPASGRACQVKEPVTEAVIMAHLAGRQPYGIYLLVKDRTRAIVVDFDTRDTLPPMEFVARATHYGMSAYIERSKSKGHHVWIFFEKKGVLAVKARLVVRHILHEIDQTNTEVFPKQDALGTGAKYGNFINLPLYGRLVPRGKTVFVDPVTFEPYPDQWEFLESACRIQESTLDEIIDLNGLETSSINRSLDSRSEGGQSSRFGLPPCAQRMLQNGVSQYQRVSCFRLAVHLKRLGLPYDVAVAALKTWALKNKPINGKGVILEKEIRSQTSCAYEKSYVGYGCESPAVKPFCDPSCALKRWMEGDRTNG